MNVAFWSNTRGRSCVTSNLACISVLSALASPDRGRTIVLENHQNILNFGSALFSRQSNQSVRESSHYQVTCGLGRLLLSLEQEDDLAEEALFRCTENYLGNRLVYLPAESIRNPDILEYRLSREYTKVIRWLEQYGDPVLVDTSAAPLESSRKILEKADLVVVNLSQSRPMMDHFFRNYSKIQKKAFYLIGNYDAESELTREELVWKYRIPQKRLGVIPHNVQFSDAVSDGKLLAFLADHYHCEKWNRNYEFMRLATEAAVLFHDRLKEIAG